MKKKLLSGAMAISLALSMLYSGASVEATQMTYCWTISDDDGTMEYEIAIPEELFEEFFWFGKYNPGSPKDEVDSYDISSRVAYHWLDIAYENGLFEDEEIYETKENGRKIFLPPTSQIDSQYQEEYPEEVEELCELYSNAVTPFQLKLCIVFYDESTEDCYEALLCYSTTEESVSEETMSLIIDNFIANGEEREVIIWPEEESEEEESEEAGTAETEEFSEEEFEETAAYQGTWITYPDTFGDSGIVWYSVYIPETWENRTTELSAQETIETGVTGLYSASDDSGACIRFLRLWGFYSIDELLSSEGFLEDYDIIDSDEIETMVINGIPAIYTEDIDASGNLRYTMHYSVGTAATFSIALYPGDRYESYADTLFYSIHLVDMEGEEAD